MSDSGIEQIMRLAPVIPVIVIDRVEDAVPMAEALVAGGLKVLEVTMRTPAALDAIRPVRLFALSTRGQVRHDQPRYADGDAFLFGPETRGLPQDVLDAVAPELQHFLDDDGAQPLQEAARHGRF